MWKQEDHLLLSHGPDELLRSCMVQGSLANHSAVSLGMEAFGTSSGEELHHEETSFIFTDWSYRKT